MERPGPEAAALPKPPVKSVDFALTTAVAPCVSPATPPPATTAVVHFTIGGKSVMTAASTIVPANECGGRVAHQKSLLATEPDDVCAQGPENARQFALRQDRKHPRYQ
jgi:hypothetical protein